MLEAYGTKAQPRPGSPHFVRLGSAFAKTLERLKTSRAVFPGTMRSRFAKGNMLLIRVALSFVESKVDQQDTARKPLLETLLLVRFQHFSSQTACIPTRTKEIDHRLGILKCEVYQGLRIVIEACTHLRRVSMMRSMMRLSSLHSDTCCGASFTEHN
jgi:hypothetical protein